MSNGVILYELIVCCNLVEVSDDSGAVGVFVMLSGALCAAQSEGQSFRKVF